MTLWKLQSASEISSKVKEWKYKILSTQNADEVYGRGSVVTWTNGVIENNSFGKSHWEVSETTPHEDICGEFKQGKLVDLRWYFNSSVTFNTLRQQIKTSGWKYDGDLVDEMGIVARYSLPTEPSLVLCMNELVGGRYSISIINLESANHNNNGKLDNKVYDVVEQLPTFNGNVNQWLASNLKYPPVAAENGIQGKVMCKFIVEQDGSISNVIVIRGIDASLDKEALRVIKSMPKWIPGKQNGKTVRCHFTMPVTFRLQ